MKLTQNRLKQLLAYDGEVGLFIWRVRRSELAYVGAVAGFIDAYGYTKREG